VVLVIKPGRAICSAAVNYFSARPATTKADSCSASVSYLLYLFLTISVIPIISTSARPILPNLQRWWNYGSINVGSVYRIRLELYANEFLSVADNRTMAAHRPGDFLRFGKEFILSFPITVGFGCAMWVVGHKLN